ncbi:MAG: thioredoxin [Clostridia bacterium]|nr:thioredoxin [Clostridia bacterium]
MKALKLSKDNFDSAIQSEKPILLDFYADWCGPCRMVAPIVEEIAGEREDIVVAKVNVDEEPALAERFGVFSIPTLVVMRNGEVINKSSGARPKEQILALLG